MWFNIFFFFSTRVFVYFAQSLCVPWCWGFWTWRRIWHFKQQFWVSILSIFIGPKWFWTVQIVLIGSKSFWSKRMNFGDIRRAHPRNSLVLVGSKSLLVRFFWTKFYNLDLSKMILTRLKQIGPRFFIFLFTRISANSCNI